MKRDFAKQWLSSFIFLTGISLNGLAAPLVPVNHSYISVSATMPLASEPGNNPATFTFSRQGNTNSAVTVSFKLSGTAFNGVDYAAVSNSITFAAGQISTNILITPISEPSATGYKTVVLSLPRNFGGSPWASPIFISIDRAVAFIAYNYTNVPPTVGILTPTNGSSYLSHPNIEIAANASDSNGWVTSVEFLADSVGLGVVSNSSEPPIFLRNSHGAGVPVVPGHRNSRLSFVWTNVPPGNYSLTAIATDNAGLKTTSAAVNVVVTTNLPVPMARIVSPLAGADLFTSGGINIYAGATELGGVIDTVTFQADGTNLGVASNYLAAEPFGSFHSRLQWQPFYFRWTNAATGAHVLTAVAADNNGIEVTSAPVSITVSTNTHHFRPRW